MPFFAEPSTRLSRVVPQDDCLSTSTSVIPYLAKKPFSAATNSGAASVRAIKPSLALLVSTSPPAAQAAERMPRDMPPNRATPLAAMIECLRKLRREASVTLLGWSLFGLSVMVGFPLGEKKRRHTARLEPESVDTVVLMRSCESRRIRPCLSFAKAVPELLRRRGTGAAAASNRREVSIESSTCGGAQTERDQCRDWLARDELRLAILRDWRRMHIRGAGMLC